jgi:phasin family protein
VAVRKSKAMATTTQAKVAEAAEPALAPEPNASPAGVQALVSEAAETVAPTAGTTIPAATVQARTTMEKTMEQATKTAEGLFKAAEEAAEFSRGNLEAVAKATQVYVAGVQDLGKQTLAMVQGLADHTVAGAKALGTVKSLKEAAEIQATYARAALEKSFSETAKLQEAALKLAEASFAPISARMTLAVEKFSKPLAA